VLDAILFVLKVVLLVLLYLFIWRVARSTGADLLSAVRGTAAGRAQAVPPWSPSGAPLPGIYPPVEEALELRPARESRTGHHASADGLTTGQIRPRLVVESSPVLTVGTEVPLGAWLTIGRAVTSDVVLDDPFVSSAHARLVPRGQSISVEDLGSTNGTFVNEKQVTEAQLRPQTRLRIGETVFRYEE